MHTSLVQFHIPPIGHHANVLFLEKFEKRNWIVKRYFFGRSAWLLDPAAVISSDYLIVTDY